MVRPIHQYINLRNLTIKKTISAVLNRRYKKKRGLKMNRILIYSNNSSILIVGNANNVDLISEYYSLIKDIPYPKKGF